MFSPFSPFVRFEGFDNGVSPLPLRSFFFARRSSVSLLRNPFDDPLVLPTRFLPGLPRDPPTRELFL